MEPGLRALAELASRQHGVVARRQLVALRFGRRAIERLIATGRLHPVHRGVYLVGHRALTDGALQQAALLAAGDGAVLSHATAGAHYGFLRVPQAPIELTVVGRRPSHPGLLVHRASELGPSDVGQVDGLAITSPARTLADLAARLTIGKLRWAIEDGRVRGLLEPDDVAQASIRACGRRGVRRLRAALDDVAGAPTITASEAERRLLDLLRAAGLPQPATNVQVAGWSVDVWWPRQRVAVEVDGFAYHGSRTAFERDRSKDLALRAAGVNVMRFSWRQITREGPAVLAAVAAELAAA